MNLDPERPSSSASGSPPSASRTPATGHVVGRTGRGRGARRTDDCGGAAVAAAVDTIAALRQFEISGRNAPMGKSNNYPRSVAKRIGAEPARAILEPVGGQGPQHLVSELRPEPSPRGRGGRLIFGSERTPPSGTSPTGETKPDFTETVEGDWRTAARATKGSSRYTVRHGLTGAPIQYAMLENARRAGWAGPRRLPRQMGELFAPFTKVAAGNPFAAAPVERTVDELITVTDRNRMISRALPPAAGCPRSGQPGCGRAADVGRRRRAGWACPRRTGCTSTATPT